MTYINNFIRNDAPEPWQLGLQDSASPISEGILRIHNEIIYYLIIILVSICWIIVSIIIRYNQSNNKFQYKYLNHGTIVPTRKCSKFKCKIYTTIRTYSTLPNENNDSIPNIWRYLFNEKWDFKRKHR